MGEANELSQSYKDCHVTYRAFKNSNGELKCQVYELDKMIKEMTLEELCKEYNAILTRYYKNKNSDPFKRLNQQKGTQLRLNLKDNEKPEKQASKKFK